MDIVVSLSFKGFRVASSYAGSHPFVGNAFYHRRVFPCHFLSARHRHSLIIIVLKLRMEIFHLYGPVTFIAVPTYSFLDPALDGARLEAVLARLSVMLVPETKQNGLTYALHPCAEGKARSPFPEGSGRCPDSVVHFLATSHGCRHSPPISLLTRFPEGI